MNSREFVEAMGEAYQAELARKCRDYAAALAEAIEDLANSVSDEDMADPDRVAELAAEVLEMKDSGVRALDAAAELERGNLTDEACEWAERCAGALDQCRTSGANDL